MTRSREAGERHRGVRRRMAPPAAIALLTLASLVGGAQAQSLDDKAVAPRSSTLVLQPGDLLRITVWPNAELGGEFMVEESGLVYLPFLGSIPAAGVSLDRLRAQLREGYGQAMQSPVVTIMPVFRVGIQGQIQRPGIYTVGPTDTFFDVIGLAGGFGPDADQQKVRIVREGEVIEVNALRALEQGIGLNSVELRSGDMIVVPLATARWNWRNVLSVIQTAATIALLVQRARR